MDNLSQVKAIESVTLSEPQLTPTLSEWVSQLLLDGAEAVHVFSDVDESQQAYRVGLDRVKVDIGARHFLIVELPNAPMDGAGYRVCTLSQGGDQ